MSGYPVLTDDHKAFMKDNAGKYTAREIADELGLYQVLVRSYCRRNKVELKKGSMARHHSNDKKKQDFSWIY